jgi:death-on-curing protein
VSIEFLTVPTVVKIHEESLALFGGIAGIRDRSLLESAVAQARVTFGGAYLHDDRFAMAAAYLFHIVKNHPFLDGNKRAGLGTTLAFLDGNGVSLEQPTPLLYDATMAVAEGRLDKDGLAGLLRELANAPG